MFETAILSYGDAPKRVWTTCMGISGQALLVLGAVLIPMLFPQVLPPAQSLLQVFLPTVPPAPPPVQPDVSRARVVHVRPFREIGGQVILPQYIPPVALDFVEAPMTSAENTVVGTRIGNNIGVPEGIGTFIAALNVVPIAPPVVRANPAPARSSEIIRVKQGGLVKPARLIRRIEPIYPATAKIARVSGVVQLEGVICVNGRMCEVKVISGNPLLVSAAVDAVRQWVYEPTTLNGDPVEVIAPITVTFRLSN